MPTTVSRLLLTRFRAIEYGRRPNGKGTMRGTSRTFGALIVLLSLAGLPLAGCKKDPTDMALSAVDPGHGTLQGEQPVSITGQFHTDIGYTVYFGTRKSENVLVRDEHTLVAVAPRSDAAGAVDLTIVADNGPAFRVVNGYLYEAGGGNVIENLGAGPSQMREGTGSNLAY
jgi:hypothetical protein